MAYIHNKPPGEAFSPDADKAVKDLGLAIALNPKDARHFLFRGYAHNQLLKPEAAWDDFKKAYALAPSEPAVRDAYEKQRAYSPEGKEEISRKLDEITRGKWR